MCCQTEGGHVKRAVGLGKMMLRRGTENAPVNVRNPDNALPVKAFKPETNALRREILALQQALKVAKQETLDARHQSKQLDAELAAIQTVQNHPTYR